MPVALPQCSTCNGMLAQGFIVDLSDGRKCIRRHFALGARKLCVALVLGVGLTASSPSPLAAQTAPHARANPANPKSTGYLGELTDEMVPPPRAGLGSNHNYYLYNGGKPIHGLVVTVEITKDIVCDEIGFHVQLNANSPKDDNIHTNYQQYVMGLQTKTPKTPDPHVGCSIEYFAKPYDFGTHNHRANLVDMPPHIVPAGAKFIIKLQYDGDNIRGAKFAYVGKNTKNRHEWTIAVPPPGLKPKGATEAPPPGAAAAWVRTPIVAFQVDLVGRSGGDNAVTKSGAGIITYSSSDAMTVTSKRPESKGSHTAETANSVYGLLPKGSSKNFTQKFAFGETAHANQ
jgi:hypothetical protein